MRSEARKLIRAATRQGWTVEDPPRGHPKLIAPDGAKIPFSKSPRGKMVATIKQMIEHGYVPAGR